MSAPVGLVIVGKQNTIRRINERAMHLLGVSLGDLRMSIVRCFTKSGSMGSFLGWLLEGSEAFETSVGGRPIKLEKVRLGTEQILLSVVQLGELEN